MMRMMMVMMMVVMMMMMVMKATLPRPTPWRSPGGGVSKPPGAWQRSASRSRPRRLAAESTGPNKGTRRKAPPSASRCPPPGVCRHDDGMGWSAGRRRLLQRRREGVKKDALRGRNISNGSVYLNQVCLSGRRSASSSQHCSRIPPPPPPPAPPPPPPPPPPQCCGGGGVFCSMSCHILPRRPWNTREEEEEEATMWNDTDGHGDLNHPAHGSTYRARSLLPSAPPRSRPLQHGG